MVMKYIWIPRPVTTNFVKELNFGVKKELPESIIQGCYFHLNQALQRKLKKYYTLPFNLTLCSRKLNFSQSSPHLRFLLLSNIKKV
ncbi:hypothetical protein MXB_4746 [Myxobolus squamalis]|nr:hypothetical protein MXB_4746 [Myxobolus squamalis]